MTATPAQVEVLELVAGHGLEPAEAGLVVGVAAAAVEELATGARAALGRSLAAEILARAGSHCARRAAILGHAVGTAVGTADGSPRAPLAAAIRERLVGHARHCPACAPHLPHDISAAKVYHLCPRPVPPRQVRSQVLTCATSPRLSGYRLIVVRRTAFGRHGFPVLAPAGSGLAGIPRRRGDARVWVAAATIAAAALAAGAVCGACRARTARRAAVLAVRAAVTGARRAAVLAVRAAVTGARLSPARIPHGSPGTLDDQGQAELGNV
jgi:hypothetical protein